MNLLILRKTVTDRSTIGKLYVDGQFECFTLEDVARPVKVAGETCIPVGVYSVKITYSPRFKRDLPLLLDVPGFEGVRIHTGNSAKDTEGCILVGQLAGADVIWQSQLAFNAIFSKLKEAQAKGEEIKLEIQSP